MILISSLFLQIKDGSTIASTEVYGADKKTYINIGSGNVFRLLWNTPSLTNDTVDHYSLSIKRHDPALNIYHDILDTTIGLVNEFFVDSPMLPIAPDQYKLAIYLVAYGKAGSVVTSNIINPYISKGSGTYVKVKPEGYNDLVMKRALGFAKFRLALADENQVVLVDADGKTLLIPDEDKTYILADALGRRLVYFEDDIPFAADADRLLSSETGWAVVQEGYTKGDDGEWHANDIRYEVLVAGGNDYYGEVIEVIVGKDADGNDIYEPLYVL